MSAQSQVIIKTYKGSQAEATKAFKADSVNMANQDYYPTSQTWVPGSYGCGAFLLALLLCVIVIGVLIFIYMLIVKPAGTLTVTYELRLTSESPKKQITDEEKTCPSCAEKIKLKALKCRFCGQQFDATEVEKQVAKLANNMNTRVACDDGNCIGILGPNGKCTKCGQPITIGGKKKIKVVNGKVTVPFRLTIYEERSEVPDGQWFRLSKWKNPGFIVMKSSWSRDWRILANEVPVVGVSFENRDEAFLSIADKPGFKISLEPDPSNQYDKNAIKVIGEAIVSGNVARKQLGFLSKEMAERVKGQELEARPYSAGLPHGDNLYYLTITILERSKAFLKKQKIEA